MRSACLAVVVVGLVAATSGTAAAYPQFQLSRDQTCTGCHISPAGGNLLNENGLLTAESTSQFGTAPEFMYGKIPLPSWLTLGGDLRASTGYIQTPEKVLATFPMQIELYAMAKLPKGLSLHTNFGTRTPTVGNESATTVWAREHYLMWRQKPDENEGLYVRLGRFMPVIGLRFAEHPIYTRRFGGTPLWSDTYGLNVSYVTPKLEFHATGFIKDPIIDPVEHYNGGAGYLEYRVTETFAVGALGMAELGADDKRFRGGVTAKLYVSKLDLLFQGEFQFVNQLIDTTPTNPNGGAPQQYVGYLMLTRMLGNAFMLDLGFGHFDPNRSIAQNERDGFDLNLHWFATSHLELVFNSRYEVMALGKDDAGAYALLQAHYRL